MCLQLFLPLSQPAPVKPPFLFRSSFFPLALACYEANKHRAAWHRVTPAIRGDGKTKKDCICFHSTQPLIPCLIILLCPLLFLWLVLKATQRLRISTCPPPHPTSTPLHLKHPLPQLKVYLRLRFSDNEGLNVNIHPTSSPTHREKETEHIPDNISELAVKLWRIIQCKNMQTFYFAV